MKNWRWLTISLIVIFFDQLTKYWALILLIPYEPVKIMPMLNFTLAYNTGAAFSFLSGMGDWHKWFFTIFNILVCGVIVYFIKQAPKKAKLQLISMSLVLGGAVGNLCDRFIHGHVIDFIEVYYKNFHWPVFNIADSAITIGAIILIIDLLVSRKGLTVCSKN